MMSGKANRAHYRQIGLLAISGVFLVIFVVAYFAGESVTHKRAAKVAELTNARIESMKARLDACTIERSALSKGKATSESTAESLNRRKEILIKDIALLQESIKVDRQNVNDCEEESRVERKHRTGTSEKDAEKALQVLKDDIVRLTQQVEDANQTKGIRRTQMKRLIRAYALENRLLANLLSATLANAANRNREGNDASVEQQNEDEEAGDYDASDVQKLNTSIINKTQNATFVKKKLPPRMKGNFSLPSRKELERLLKRSRQNKATGNNSSGSQQLSWADENFDEEENGDLVVNQPKKQKSKESSVTQSPKSLNDLLDDMEEGLLAVNELDLPPEYELLMNAGGKKKRIGANPNAVYVEKRKRGRAGMWDKNAVKPRKRVPKTSAPEEGSEQI